MDGIGKNIFALATAIVGVAIIAVIVSKRSATVEVINAAANAYTGALKEAVRPITG